jgi:hypothetical protein
MPVAILMAMKKFSCFNTIQAIAVFHTTHPNLIYVSKLAKKIYIVLPTQCLKGEGTTTAKL